MKKQLLFRLILGLLFSTSVYSAQYKNYITSSYPSNDGNGYFFEFSTSSLTENSSFSFTRHTDNCGTYNAIIRAFNVLSEPSNELEVKEEKHFGEARIDKGLPFPFTWILILPENSTDVVMVVDETHDSQRLTQSLIKGTQVDITLFINDKRYIDRFSLMGFTAASTASYNECVKYNTDRSASNERIIEDIKIALKEAGLPFDEEIVEEVIKRMMEDEKAGLEPNARRAVISLQKEILEKQRKYLDDHRNQKEKDYLNI